MPLQLGGSATSNARKEAVRKALYQAELVAGSSKSPMKDDAYSASVKSYAEMNGLASGNG